MLNYNVKIGWVAMRRNTTDRPRGTFLTWYSAEQRGKRFVDYIENNFASENVSFVDNKGIGIEDLVFDDASAAEVIERFKNEKVDAVMIINCNFGNEEAAATANVTVTDTFDPVLEGITVTLNGAPLAEGTGYTYAEASGQFATVPSVITVPAATYAQDPVSGEWTTTPGSAVLTVSGTI